MSQKSDLTKLSERLGYAFRDRDLLEQAFRHASYVNEVGDPNLSDNERLEFLGDAVLDLAISHLLMEFFEVAKEGDLSKFRASLVDEKGLCKLAGELKLGNYLLLGKGEELTGGREKPSILANTVEALLGALYLDAGFTKAMEVIRRLFIPFLLKVDSREHTRDFKSLLQEHSQDAYKTRPEYVLVHESGPAHEKTFRIAVYLNGELKAEAEGKSKKEAEQKAAKEAFLCLRKDQKGL